MLRKRRPKPKADGGDADTALAAAAALLSRRDFCAAELAGRLAEHGFAAAAVQAAIDELTARGYVDDARYASQFVSYRAARGQGPIRIGRELTDLGMSESLIDAAIAAYEQEHGWTQLAVTLRRRRFGSEPPADWPEKARQARFLQYRGFSNDHIRSALGADAIAEQ